MAFLHKLHQWVIGHYETVSNIDFTKILVIFTILLLGAFLFCNERTFFKKFKNIFNFQIGGEELITKIENLQKTDGTFVDLPLGTYVGCKGLKEIVKFM